MVLKLTFHPRRFTSALVWVTHVAITMPLGVGMRPVLNLASRLVKLRIMQWGSRNTDLRWMFRALLLVPLASRLFDWCRFARSCLKTLRLTPTPRMSLLNLTMSAPASWLRMRPNILRRYELSVPTGGTLLKPSKCYAHTT